MKNTKTKEIKISPTIGLPLDELEPMNLSNLQEPKLNSIIQIIKADKDHGRLAEAESPMNRFTRVEVHLLASA